MVCSNTTPAAKPCACAYIAFLAGIFSWYAESIMVRKCDVALTCSHSDVATVYTSHGVIGHAAVSRRVNVMPVAAGTKRREEQRPISQNFSGLRNRSHWFPVPWQPADVGRRTAFRRTVNASSRLVRKVHTRRWFLQERWAHEGCCSCGHRRNNSYRLTCFERHFNNNNQTSEVLRTLRMRNCFFGNDIGFQP
jgi:hypothetical protein